jgi:hypothetical protein
MNVNNIGGRPSSAVRWASSASFRSCCWPSSAPFGTLNDLLAIPVAIR